MLKYYYGTMASGKSATLLMNAYQKKQNGVGVLILKPCENRDKDKVKSRIGLESECITFSPEDNLSEIIYNEVAKREEFLEIYIDECQFLTKEQVEQLWYTSRGMMNINCFGLMVTYRNELFEGIKTLIVYADSMKELEPSCVCKYCSDIATTHLLMIDGKAVLDLPEKVEGDIEGDMHFECVCIKCWKIKTEQE